MQTPKVSIIVPIYNVEKYLPACLDSLVGQTLREIEIICVDDGSPDNSVEIVQRYMQQDNRIRLVRHEQNQGLGPARNTGLKVATAPYIMFVDSDDYVDTAMAQILYDSITQKAVDVAWCYANSVDEDGVEYPNADLRIEGVLTAEQVLKDYRLYPSILPVWNKLYKRDLIRDIEQPAIVSEDQPFLAEWLCRCDKISIIDKGLYFYRNRQGTLSKPKLHTAQNWDAFFYSHALFFRNLEQGNFSEKAVQMQCRKRLFSMLWRIKMFRLIEQPTWSEQQAAIAKHLSESDIPIKPSSPCNVFLKLCFAHRWSLSVMQKWVNKLYKYSRTWIVSDSWGITLRLVTKDLLKKLILICRLVLDRIELSVVKVATCFVPKDIWLTGERNDTAQENGIYFFNYLQQFHPEIKAYYVCNQAIADKADLHGHWLKYNSLKHKIYFCAAGVYASSQYNANYPSTVFGKKHYPFPPKGFNVFLQHGITYADVSPFYGKKTSDINLFICGATPEYEAVRKDFGYGINEVGLTGFARFDGLHGYEEKRQILLMPTWRRQLAECPLSDFAQNGYYKAIKGLLTDKAVAAFLRDNNMVLKFCPHYLMNAYLPLFADVQNDVVIIANPETESVQSMLKESMVLITDVSSVQFDFAYMKKPLIYYWWDYEQIIREHLQKGYFDFETMGFGPVVREMHDLLNRLQELAHNEWKNEKTYVDKINRFFPYNDSDNCKRIYDEILKRL
ncbi:MAG: CDP-glycerol glycerophosphotransferase family protein [Bacteroidales bacterium]|nr:CDP-glycerol glycerophosphotransferase family protein [Bacteroidales bacterium]